MADVEEPALAKAAARVAARVPEARVPEARVALEARVPEARTAKASGGAVLPVVTDVADRAAVDALRDAALSVLGASPAEVAALVVDGIRSRRFYILTSDNRHEPVLRRGQEIVAGGPPAPPVSFV